MENIQVREREEMYMTDKISIKIENLEVNLPQTHIIVEKDEYLNLRSKLLRGNI